MPTDKTLAEDGTENKRLVIRLTEYEGNRLLDLRFWYFNKKELEWHRTKKGIMLNRENFICAKRAFESHNEDILSWLGIGYVPEHVEKYANEQQEAVEKGAYAPDMVSTSTVDQPRNPAFFDVVHRGGRTEVEYNESHPLYAKVGANGGDSSTSRLLALVLASYHRAKERLGDSPATDASILFDQLEHDWANYLTGYLTEK